MKRLHIHIAVNNLSESINFYSTIFNALPSIERESYAKWDLTEPAVNFAISNRNQVNGINHLGIQVDSEDELAAIAKRFDKAEISSSKQQGSSCCFAYSNKHWTQDPQGIAWESFHTLKEIPTFGEDTKFDTKNQSSTCCIPLTMQAQTNKKETIACCIPNKGEDAVYCS